MEKQVKLSNLFKVLKTFEICIKQHNRDSYPDMKARLNAIKNLEPSLIDQAIKMIQITESASPSKTFYCQNYEAMDNYLKKQVRLIKLEMKELSAKNNLSFDFGLEIKVKTVTNEVVTQLALF